MVGFRVDRASGVPAYRQLVRQVTEALRLGWLRPGEKLPTVRDVVAGSGVNANTVLRAYRELEHAGLVEMRQGSGTFVTDTAGAIDAAVMAELRAGLAEWVGQAHTYGLANEDVQALLRATLAEEGFDVG